MENEFDVRKYVLDVLKRWPIILLATVVAGLTAFGVSMILPKTYTAKSVVLLFVRQTGSQLGVNEALINVESIDSGARRVGLVALAQSDTIESLLPADVVQRIVPDDYKPGLIVRNEQINVVSQGDLLEIRATAPTAQQAKDLADVWATTYVDLIRRLYTDEHTRVEPVSNALLPINPSGPGIIRNTAVGVLSGFLFGLTVAMVMTLFMPKSLAPQRVRADRPTTQPSPTR
jgi:uncharacterized protein involved in exopolysaccharide biosynthesis